MMSQQKTTSIAQATRNICHSGVVELIEDNHVIISVFPPSNCSSCHIKHGCGIRDKITVTIPMLENKNLFNVGEKVQLQMNINSGYLALFWMYILPFLLLIAVLFITAPLMGELYSGVIALLSLVPYYFIFYLFGNNKKDQIAYILTRVNND